MWQLAAAKHLIHRHYLCCVAVAFLNAQSLLILVALMLVSAAVINHIHIPPLHPIILVLKLTLTHVLQTSKTFVFSMIHSHAKGKTLISPRRMLIIQAYKGKYQQKNQLLMSRYVKMKLQLLFLQPC